LYKRAYVAWVQYYRLHRKSIKGYLRLKQAHTKALKSRMMKLWLRRSAPTLTKMRAVRFMLRLRQKKLIRSRFQTWVDQVNFFISLDMRVQELQAKIGRRDKIEGLRRMAMHAHSSKLHKDRTADVRHYACKKLQNKTLQFLKSYTFHRQQRRNLNALATKHYL
jgi:hypothetical protein